MSKKRILVVDDEIDISTVLKFVLMKQDFEVFTAPSCSEAASVLQREPLIELILLDVMLPDKNGLDFCKELRTLPEYSKVAGVPIIMITAKSDEESVVRGLENGADDYVSKPFREKELVARIRSVLTRARYDGGEDVSDQPPEQTIFEYKEIYLDTERHEATFCGSPVNLTISEFGILRCLLSDIGHVFTRKKLVKQVKGEQTSVTERTIDVQVAGLRKKMGEAGAYIETIRGVGYRIKD